ncbi:MAG: nucleotidyltransferase substrate binding protein [Bacteroidaceae bacterium]|nr:nucleotidyltransferase substrate binding protein [Bacteroidaceae bacterium]
MEAIPVRWHDRFRAFKNALARLEEVIELKRQRSLTPFECDSLIKRFEFTYELAWKLMMSYEKYNGIMEVVGSKDAIRKAYSLSLIDNGEAWLEMVDDRNKTSHLYDEDMAVDVIDEIIYTYYPLFLELQSKMERLVGD